MSDDEVDYCFQVSKALGAAALSTEISIEETKRVGQFADKHKMPIGYHGHATTSAADFETVLSYAKYNAVNLDLGHFTAGQNRVAGAVPQETSRSDHPRARQGSQAQQRSECAARPGRHADQGGAPG